LRGSQQKNNLTSKGEVVSLCGGPFFRSKGEECSKVLPRQQQPLCLSVRRVHEERMKKKTSTVLGKMRNDDVENNKARVKKIREEITPERNRRLRSYISSHLLPLLSLFHTRS